MKHYRKCTKCEELPFYSHKTSVKVKHLGSAGSISYEVSLLWLYPSFIRLWTMMNHVNIWKKRNQSDDCITLLCLFLNCCFFFQIFGSIDSCFWEEGKGAKRDGSSWLSFALIDFSSVLLAPPAKSCLKYEWVYDFTYVLNDWIRKKCFCFGCHEALCAFEREHGLLFKKRCDDQNSLGSFFANKIIWRKKPYLIIIISVCYSGCCQLCNSKEKKTPQNIALIFANGSLISKRKWSIPRKSNKIAECYQNILWKISVVVNCYCGCCWEPLSFGWNMLPLLIIRMVLFGAACRTYTNIGMFVLCFVTCTRISCMPKPEERKKKLKIIDFIGFCGLWKLVLLVLESIFFSFNQLWWHMAVTGAFHFFHFILCHKFTFQLQKPFTFQSVVGWNKCKYTLEMGSVFATFSG